MMNFIPTACATALCALLSGPAGPTTAADIFTEICADAWDDRSAAASKLVRSNLEGDSAVGAGGETFFASYTADTPLANYMMFSVQEDRFAAVSQGVCSVHMIQYDRDSDAPNAAPALLEAARALLPSPQEEIGGVMASPRALLDGDAPPTRHVIRAEADDAALTFTLTSDGARYVNASVFWVKQNSEEE